MFVEIRLNCSFKTMTSALILPIFHKFFIENNLQLSNLSIIFYYRKLMNTSFKTESGNLMKNSNTHTHLLHFFRKIDSRGFDNDSENNKSPLEKTFSKDKYEKQRNQYHKLKNHEGKDNQIMSIHSKLHLQENMMEKIDKILLKNALANKKYHTTQQTMNNSIEEVYNQLSPTQPSSNISSQVGNYTPLTTQNEQQHKQNSIQTKKSKNKVILNKLREVVKKNLTFSITKQTRSLQFNKISFEQLKLRTEIVTPSENQWQNSMNLLRLQRKQNEKNKKYCRIIIRKINTDQLFTKRTESQARINSNKTYNLNRIKLAKPITNVLTESTSPKIYKNQIQNLKGFDNGQQSLQLNPWSTSQIKLRQQSQLTHHY